MKIWHKILVAPAVAICFLLAVGVMAHFMLAKQGEALEELATQRMARAAATAESARDVGELHSSVYRLLTWIGNLDEAKIKATWGDLKAKGAKASERITALAAHQNLESAERALLEEANSALAKYRAGVDKAVDLSTIDVGTGMMAMQTADVTFQALDRKFDELVALENRLAVASYEKAAAAVRWTQMMLAMIVGLAVVAAVAVALRMSTVIVRPLKAAIGAANRIADGDLTVQVQVKGTDETGQLLRALASMSTSLRSIVSEVAGGARTVADTSSQIAQGNIDLSQRTEEQASTLEETASSMEELTATVQQNAANARQASDLAGAAANVATRGGAVVGAVVTTMSEISSSSRRIGDIISVIDGIAFQTNILALNAAVEAARAGDQGRGFAVVAAEVRNLAHRSASAAKEIKGLIQDSIDKVDAGTKLVGDAGSTMDDIVRSVAQVSDLVAEIAAASQEQSSGIQQVNTAVTQMEHVVQQNASLVEEASAATESMRAEAGALLQSVSRFKLAEAGNEPRDPAHVAPAAYAPRVEEARVVPLRARPAVAAPQVNRTAPRKVANGEWQDF